MTVSIEKLDALLLLCGNLAEQFVCQFWAAHSSYTTTSSTEEVCGAQRSYGFWQLFWLSRKQHCSTSCVRWISGVRIGKIRED